MNKDQIKKHFDVIQWFIQPENTDKGVLCDYGYGWEVVHTPKFVVAHKYVQNDAYAELRKAQADGKQLEWSWKDKNKWFPIENEWNNKLYDYRIKPDDEPSKDFEKEKQRFRETSSKILLQFAKQSAENYDVAFKLYNFINTHMHYVVGWKSVMEFDMDEVDDIFYRRNKLKET